MYYKGTVKDLLTMPHYHPTLSKILTYPAEKLAQRNSLLIQWLNRRYQGRQSGNTQGPL